MKIFDVFFVAMITFPVTPVTTNLALGQLSDFRMPPASPAYIWAFAQKENYVRKT